MLHKVLFVDDEPKVTRAMKNTLRKENYEILSAESAKEALGILERESVDIVISDEQMPGMSGTDFLVLVKRKYPEIFRILLTGHAGSQAALKAINEAKVYRFLTKPCNGLDLLITIRRALEHKTILKKTGRLLSAGDYQFRLLQKLTTEQADIVQAAKNALGTAVMDKFPHDIDTLLNEIDAALEKTGELLGNIQVAAAADLPSDAPSPGIDKAAEKTSGTSCGSTQEKATESSPQAPEAEEKTTPPAPGGDATLDESVADLLDGVESVKDLKPMMTRSEIQEHLDNCSELKGMSPTVAQILKLTQSPRCSLEQVVKVIKQDHAVSLKILKLANSSTYTRGEPVDTVQKAVLRIGLTQIRQAVLNISVVDQFSGEDQEIQLSTPQFWEHSIATGLITVELAHALTDKTADLDIAFTMGLLHDIGRIIYIEMLGKEYQRVLKIAEFLHAPLEQVESRLLLINHADAMDRILHRWKFPKDLVNPIALHQLSLGNIRRMAPNAINEVATLALANRLAHALLLGTSGNLSLYPTEEFVSLLRLKPDVIKKIEEEIPGQTDDIKFSMLASVNQQTWPRLRDQLSGQLQQPFRPIHVSAEPEYDALRIFCDRLRDISEEESPNVGIIHIKRGQERVPVTTKFKQAETEASVESLPLIILSPKGDMQLEERAMADRQFELLPFPISISRFIEAFNKIVSP
jgi:two-component system probable response regulator PhcQ